MLLACIRAADALLYCLPAERDGFDEGLLVAEEVTSAEIALPAAVLVTKADLPGADTYIAEAASRLPGLRLGITSQGAARRPVADLIWSLLDLIRVWPAPKGRRAEEPVILPRDSTVEDFMRKLDNRWVERFRRARVSGPSAQFSGQMVGRSHVLQDGDEVDVALHG